MELEQSRRSVLTGGTALVVTLVTRGGAVRADTLPEVTVYKSPT